MFDEDKYTESDNLMRSILSQGQEDVPAHIWDGISSKLDRIEATQDRKPVILWFRRGAAAVAAAAAVAVGVFMNPGRSDDLLPASAEKGLIAVDDTPEINVVIPECRPGNFAVRSLNYVADASDAVAKSVNITDDEHDKERAQQEQAATPKTDTGKSMKQETAPEAERWPDVWEDETDAPEANKRKTSIVLSGVAGTNNAQSGRISPLRRPSMSTSKPKTGVEQKSSEATYGLPVSLGIGVKMELSDRWSLGAGVNYTLLASKFFGTYTLTNSEGSVEASISSDIRNVQQYIGIPVNAYYDFVSSDYVNFYAYAGGAVERCISNKYDILNTSHIHKGGVQGVQLSANAGIGVEFLLGRHLGLYLDPSIRYYFNCGQPKSIRTAQPLMLGFEMGLRINL
ncbi:MAG: PorT family protein [Bacteroidales bacterium]|nr:PorT family protein [Bacteroidales bacterium]